MKHGMKHGCTRFAAWLLGFALILCAIPAVVIPVSADDMAKYEKQTYLKPSAGPMESKPQSVTLRPGGTASEDSAWTLTLDGTWKMQSTGRISELAAGNGWGSAYEAEVPGSIYTGLMEAGVIEDPYLGKNMVKANRYSEKNWYFCRTFAYEGNGNRVRLAFDGVCNVADFYLNGKKIASHEGMFGGPYIDVTDSIRKGENTLVVHLKPAKDYARTVVFNCSYGWHYAKLVPLGIWQSVRVEDVPGVEMERPFVSTYDYKKGTVDLYCELERVGSARLDGILTGVIVPKNFEGKTYSFSTQVHAGTASATALHLRFDIPDARLWWPAGYGEQNLYTMYVTYTGSDGATRTTSADFGIRELAYASYPDGESASAYNRTVVINGQSVYMKGAGWCTIDAMMRFGREDYDRILSRARDAGINFLRAWGGGLLETEEFYDLCDEYGICVYQEWPCCWDSQKTQPMDVLRETIRLNAKRLRSRASLIIWGGGNEGVAALDDQNLNEIGRLTYEYDGTRVFWRQDGGVGGGGIAHDHIHWSGASPEHYCKTYADFRGLNLMEYGLDGMMNPDSIAKFATGDSLHEWPLSRDGVLAYHTATFNGTTGWTPTPYGYDVDTFLHYASAFLKVDSLEDMVLGSQLAQAQADYLAAQNARMNFPYNTANCVYKLNDVYPGASWAIVDWYGAPKIAYYLMQDAYRPLMAAGKFDRYHTRNAAGEDQPFRMPVYLLDDADALAAGQKWQVRVTAWNAQLEAVRTETWDGQGSVGRLRELGVFALTAEQTASTPLIITVDLLLGGSLYNRSYTYMNYEYRTGSLFCLPRTYLTWSQNGNQITVTNTGSVPAASVHFLVDDTAAFTCEDNYFFLAAGESVTLQVSDGAAVRGVSCFNLADPADKVAPTTPGNTALTDVTHEGATLTWSASTDDVSLFGYELYLDGKCVDFVPADELSYTFTGLSEVTRYHVTVAALDDNGNRSAMARGFSFTTDADTAAPRLLRAERVEDGTLLLRFDRALDSDSVRIAEQYLLNHGARVTAAVPGEDAATVVLTVEHMDADVVYTLGVVGVRAAGYRKTRMPYTQVQLDDGLAMSVSFEPDNRGRLFTGGAELRQLFPIQSGAATDSGKSGYGWACAKGGAGAADVTYTFREGCSVGMWYNGAASDGFNVLLAKGPKTDGHFEFYAASGNLQFYAPEIGDIRLNASLDRTPGWHYLVFTWQDGHISTWIDGQNVGNAAVRGKISETTKTLSIGSLNDGSIPYAGILDEVRLYTRVLSAGEMAREAGNAASVVIDVEGNDCGKARQSGFTFTDGQAVNLWFQIDDISSFNILLARGTKATDRHFELFMEWGKLKIYAPTGNGNTAVSLGVDMSGYAGAWHMLTAVRRGNTVVVYIDGKEAGKGNADFIAAGGEETLYIGRLVEGGFDFLGKLTGVELLETAPDDAEMVKMYRAHVQEVAPAGTIRFTESLLTMTENTEASLGLETDETGYRLEVIGDAVTVSDGTVRAVKPGSALVVAYSADGLRMTALSVEVRRVGEQETPVDTTPIPDPELPPETETDAETESEPEPESDTETSASAGNEMTVPDSSHTGESDEITADRRLGYTIVAFGASVLGILALVAWVVLRRKKANRTDGRSA